MSDDLKTDDAKLAAYLCLIGYESPEYIIDGKATKYLFHSVSQEDVLNFYNKCPVHISPLAVFEKRDELVARSKIAALNIAIDVFNIIS